jgi:exonuclease 1
LLLTMGITGLLRVLKSITHQTRLEELRGQTVAIDTLCWLHRGVYSCAQRLALGEATLGYVRFCEAMLDLVLSFGIKPFFVFDGSYLPAKRGKETERRDQRKAALEAGLAAHAKGDTAAAHTAFSSAVDVTPQMAYQFIRVLRQVRTI